MNKVGQFEKVSLQQFEKDFGETNLDVTSIYNEIKLPIRATSGSAGYDFYAPSDIRLAPGKSIKVITGIRVRIDEGWMLMICPRSGLGYKYRVQLDNTVGIIDSDYYGSDNEGHIQIKITNDSREGKVLELAAGDRFAQGIFLPYGITTDDTALATRNGGFGSTN